MEQSHETGEENKSKNPITGRFAKRNYRKRSDSQSSTSSVPMEATTSEPINEPKPNGNNLEVKQLK